MKALLAQAAAFLKGDPQADRIVPPSGFTARLTILSAAAMAFLAVFALALSLSMGRLAADWAGELEGTATLRLPDAEAAETALALLQATPGIAQARLIPPEEQQALLAPWFGPDLPLDDLPLPTLIEITEDGADLAGLRARLAGELPEAILDTHDAWRGPLVAAADRLRLLGWICLTLIAGVTVAIITLAVRTSLAANNQVIGVLRLVGARDVTIARAFVRRFTLRALLGAASGTVLGCTAILLLPAGDAVLPGLGFRGAGWLLPLLIPILAALAAFAATRAAALSVLKEMT